MSPSLSPSSPWYETPYIYVKNYFQNWLSTGVPTGPVGNVINDVIPSDGDSDFFARRSLGAFNFNDKDGNAFISGMPPLGVNPAGFGQPGAFQSFYGADFALAPEKFFPLGGNIPIQVFQSVGLTGATAPSTGPLITMTFPGGTTAFVGYTSVLFQGVKRRKGVADRDPGYKFYEKPFTYTLPFTLDWTYLTAPFTSFKVASNKSFYIQVLDYDFELWAIETDADFNNTSGGFNPLNGYAMILYDANSYKLMRDFVHYRFLSYEGGFNGVGVPPGNTATWYPNCYPVPTVVYPKGSVIQIDIQSLMDSNTAAYGATTIRLRGVRRMPC